MARRTSAPPKEAIVQAAKITDLQPDIRNANRGTQRGRSALEASLRKLGAGRSILIDKHGRIVAGNKTAETAADIGLDDVLIVQTDGSQIVAVQRTDIDLDSPQGREMAYADNRVGQLDLDFDVEQISIDLGEGFDLSWLWKKDELDMMLAELHPKMDELAGVDVVPQQWIIMIECDGETEQAQLLQQFEAEGLKCRALIS